MRTILMLKGLPASGKSTYSKDLLKREPARWRRVNRDDLRYMLDDRFEVASEKLINTIQTEAIKCIINEGYDVIVDNTHLNQSVVNKMHKLAKSLGDITVMEKCFNISVDECLKRNALRTGHGRVPDKVIIDMARGAKLDKGRKLNDSQTYYPPLAGQGTIVIQDPKLPKAIICDLDGTAALLNGRNPYDASTCDQDLPNEPVIACVKALQLAGYKIVFMSGREDKFREPTLKFLANHFDFDFELHMRVTDDQRKDAIVKRELFDTNVLPKYFVEFCLDDRDQVVQGWRDMGLTCFQVAPGAF